MKIPCVRCGKKIESPHVYCRDCSREIEGENQGLAAPTRRRRWPWILLLLLLAAGAWGYYTLPGDTMSEKLASLEKEVPAVTELAEELGEDIAEHLPQDLVPEDLASENATSADSAAEDSATEDVASEDVATEDVASEDVAAENLQPPQEPQTPPASLQPAEPAQPGAESDDVIVFDAADDSPQQTAADDATDQDNATAEETLAQAVPPASQEDAPLPEEGEAAETPGEDMATVNATEPAPAEQSATQDLAATTPQEGEQPAEEAEPETPETVDHGVWVFWMDKEGADKKLVEHLKSEGYVNSVAKGQWPGHFNDKNIFYRYEDKRGLERLRKSLKTDDYYDYYYNNERIGQNVKRIFHQHDDVLFVIILQ